MPVVAVCSFRLYNFFLFYTFFFVFSKKKNQNKTKNIFPSLLLFFSSRLLKFYFRKEKIFFFPIIFKSKQQLRGKKIWNSNSVSNSNTIDNELFAFVHHHNNIDATQCDFVYNEHLFEHVCLLLAD